MKYDANNRLTNMADAVGTTTFSYTDFGALLTEDGPWDNDTIAYSYTANGLRSKLSLQQPNGYPWEQTYAYDSANRLTNVTSPAGTFGYLYDDTSHLRVRKLTLPIGAYITNTYDALSRMTGTYLKNSSDTTRNSHAYTYDAGSRRTRQTRTGGDYVDYTYDNISQLKTALGLESDGTTRRMNEQFSYGYDGAWNLNYRTNGALLETFNVDSLNQLTTITRSGSLTVIGNTWGAATNVTVNSLSAIRYADNTFARTNVTLSDGTNTFTAVAQDSSGRTDTDVVTAYLPATVSFAYDGNGNLITNGARFLEYDDENQLARITEPNSWKSEFTYDGKMRRRVRREYTWKSGAWSLRSEIHYICDGSLVIQERDANNLPVVAYTRGNDLSGSFEAAGGIGGLLSFSQLSSVSPHHWCYHGDGNGNVTALISVQQTTLAKYVQDPFGYVCFSLGPVGEINPNRFSSKEYDSSSGFVYFLYRHYVPSLQRWLNADPLGDEVRLNHYYPKRRARARVRLQTLNSLQFVRNRPLELYDAFGLDDKPNCKINVPKASRDEDWVNCCQDWCLYACAKAPSPDQCAIKCNESCDELELPKILACLLEVREPPKLPK